MTCASTIATTAIPRSQSRYSSRCAGRGRDAVGQGWTSNAVVNAMSRAASWTPSSTCSCDSAIARRTASSGHGAVDDERQRDAGEAMRRRLRALAVKGDVEAGDWRDVPF